VRTNTQQSHNRYIIIAIKNVYISNHITKSCKLVILRVQNYQRFDLISNFLTHTINYLQVNKC